MRDSVKEAIGSAVQDIIDSGVKVSFTKKELDELGVKVPTILTYPKTTPQSQESLPRLSKR